VLFFKHAACGFSDTHRFLPSFVVSILGFGFGLDLAFQQTGHGQYCRGACGCCRTRHVPKAKSDFETLALFAYSCWNKVGYRGLVASVQPQFLADIVGEKPGRIANRAGRCLDGSVGQSAIRASLGAWRHMQIEIVCQWR